MTIKLIALDMDGTTLNSKGRISDKTKAALESAIDRGVAVVVATGRPSSALPEDIFQVDAIRYAITSNGAAITDLKTGEVIYRNCMISDTVQAAVEMLKKYSYIIEAFTDGKAYLQADYYEQVKRTGESFRNVEYVLKTRNPVGDIYQFMLDNKDSLENINVNLEDIGDKAEMYQELCKLPNATITSSLSNNLEIGGETTSKAAAVEYLMQMLGVSQAEMMAAGDSPNDGEMLKLAGLAVAMGNSVEELKALADFITLSNDEDGVAYAIEKFVLI